MARRFVCPQDPAWRLFHDGLCALGALVALLALLLQNLPVMGALLVAAVAGLGMSIVVWRRVRRIRPARHPDLSPDLDPDPGSEATVHAGAARMDLHSADQLRWDTQQWWWHPASAHPDGRAAGAPLAITPMVVLDLEHWMLLRLVPKDPTQTGGRMAWRFWRHHLMTVSRRHHAGDWSLLRIHLFMARE